MRIGIDCTLFHGGRFTGVENYALNLVMALLKLDRANRYVLFFRKEIPPELETAETKVEVHVSPTSMRVPTDQIWMPWALKGARIDLLHCPAFPSPFLTSCPTILTVHDAALWKYPGTISKGGRFYYRPLFPQAIRKARKIVAVSNSTKEDLRGLFPGVSHKTEVIHNGVDHLVFTRAHDDAPDSGYGLKRHGYILTVGSIEPRKNLHTLLKAFQILSHTGTGPLQLALVGRRGWLKELAIPPDIMDRVILTGYVRDNLELADLYRGAALFVLPSLYEGFGLPVLEAMSTGTPVLCSATSSLPEVAGDAALYADPNSAEDFAAKMAQILASSALREDMIQKGLQRSRQFTWEKTAQETIRVYEEVGTEISAH